MGAGAATRPEPQCSVVKKFRVRTATLHYRGIHIIKEEEKKKSRTKSTAKSCGMDLASDSVLAGHAVGCGALRDVAGRCLVVEFDFFFGP